MYVYVLVPTHNSEPTRTASECYKYVRECSYLQWRCVHTWPHICAFLRLLPPPAGVLAPARPVRVRGIATSPLRGVTRTSVASPAPPIAPFPTRSSDCTEQLPPPSLSYPGPAQAHKSLLPNWRRVEQIGGGQCVWRSNPSSAS